MPSLMNSDPIRLYEVLKKHEERKRHGEATRQVLLALISQSVINLSGSEKVDLVS